MAVQHLSTLICENLIRGEDGKFSFINSFGNIRIVEGFEAMAMYCIVVVLGDDGDSVGVSVVDPNGKILLNVNNTIRIPDEKEHPFQRFVSNLILRGGFPLEVEGVYHVLTRSGEEVIHRFPFGAYSLSTPEVDESE